MIVTYNKIPDISKILRSVSSGEIDTLIISDNSKSKEILDGIECQVPEILKSKVRIIENEVNLGVSKAINIAFKVGIQEGFFYFHLLDDDAVISGDLFKIERKYYEVLESKGIKIGAICPVVANDLHSLNRRFRLFSEVSSVKLCITSGALITKEVIVTLGGYRESFFLEFADMDFSDRLLRAGFRIFRINSILVVQEFGKNFTFETSVIKLFKIFLITTHSFMLILNISNDFFYNPFYYSIDRRRRTLRESRARYYLRLREDTKLHSRLLNRAWQYILVDFYELAKGMFLMAIFRDSNYLLASIGR